MYFSLIHRVSYLLERSGCKGLHLTDVLLIVEHLPQNQLKLENYLESKQLVFVDGLSQTSGMGATLRIPAENPQVIRSPPLFAGEDASLKPLFDLVAPLLTSSPGCLLMLDDLALLEWMGVSLVDFHKFLRALLHLIHKVSHSVHAHMDFPQALLQNSCSLLLRYRSLSLDAASDTMIVLRNHCSLHIEVLSLFSGRSSAVSGEVGHLL